MGYTTGHRSTVQIDGYTQEEVDGLFDVDRQQNLMYNPNFRINQRNQGTVDGTWEYVRDRWGMRGAANTGGSTTTTTEIASASSWNSSAYMQCTISGHTANSYIFQRLPHANRFSAKTLTFGIVFSPDASMRVKVRPTVEYSDGTNKALTTKLESLTGGQQTQVIHTFDIGDIDPAKEDDAYLQIDLVLDGGTDGSPLPDMIMRVSEAQMFYGDRLPTYFDPDPASEFHRCEWFYKRLGNMFLMAYGNSPSSRSLVDLSPFWAHGKMFQTPVLTYDGISSGSVLNAGPNYISATPSGSNAASATNVALDAEIN